MQKDTEPSFFPWFGFQCTSFSFFFSFFLSPSLCLFFLHMRNNVCTYRLHLLDLYIYIYFFFFIFKLRVYTLVFPFACMPCLFCRSSEDGPSWTRNPGSCLIQGCYPMKRRQNKYCSQKSAPTWLQRRIFLASATVRSEHAPLFPRHRCPSVPLSWPCQ